MRQKYAFFGVQNLRRLSHEMDTAEDYDVCVTLGRFHREAEGISGEVGDVLDFGHLVIVRQDYRVLFFAKTVDLRHQLFHRQVVIIKWLIGLAVRGASFTHDLFALRHRAVLILYRQEKCAKILFESGR